MKNIYLNKKSVNQSTQKKKKLKNKIIGKNPFKNENDRSTLEWWRITTSIFEQFPPKSARVVPAHRNPRVRV